MLEWAQKHDPRCIQCREFMEIVGKTGIIISMMRKYLVLFLMMTGILLTAGAQSNAQLDAFLSLETADAAGSLLLVAQATGALAPDAAPSDAMVWASEQKWGKRLESLNGDEAMTTGLFHLALFESFGISGGWGYTLSRSPRTAALEAGYKGFITGRPYVNHRMTPDEVMYSLSKALEWQEMKDEKEAAE